MPAVIVIPIIISLLSSMISLYMLYLTRVDMNRREKIDREMRLHGAYQNFQLLNLNLIQDKDGLLQLAKDRGLKPVQAKELAIASLWINQSLHVFQLFEGGHLDPEVWKRFQTDLKGLYSRPSISKRWDQVRGYYPITFQQYIDDFIFS